MKRFRTFRYHLVKDADEWMHYHRFDWRWLCDYFERLNGTPKDLLRRERANHHRKHRLPHDVGNKFRRHPSHIKETV